MDDDDYEPLDYFGSPPTVGDSWNSSQSSGGSTPSLAAKNRADDATIVSSKHRRRSEPRMTYNDGKSVQHPTIRSHSEDLAEAPPPPLPPKSKDLHPHWPQPKAAFRDRITSMPAKSATLGSHAQRKPSFPLPTRPNGTHGINNTIARVPREYIHPKSTLLPLAGPSVNGSDLLPRSHSPIQTTSTFKPQDPVTMGTTRLASNKTQETIAHSRPTPPAPYNTPHPPPPTITKSTTPPTNTTTQDRNQPTYVNTAPRPTTTVNLPVPTYVNTAPRPTTAVNLPVSTPEPHPTGSPQEDSVKYAYVTMNPAATLMPSLADGSRYTIPRTPPIQRRVTVDYGSMKSTPLDMKTSGFAPGQFTFQSAARALQEQLAVVEESNAKLSEHTTDLESDLQQSLEQLIDHQQWMESEIKTLVQQVDALQTQLVSSGGLWGKSPSSFHASPEPEWSRQRGPTDGESETASELHCSAELNKQHLASISSTQVLQLLQLLGLQRYTPSFQRHQVDGEFLSECSESMLCKSLRVTSHLHRLRLLKIIRGHQPVQQMLKT